VSLARGTRGCPGLEENPFLFADGGLFNSLKELLNDEVYKVDKLNGAVRGADVRAMKQTSTLKVDDSQVKHYQ
jgi:hypothetical protein